MFLCSFIPDTSVNPSIDFSNLFKIDPLHASLLPGEKAKAVSITFLARREIALQNQSLLKCQVSMLEFLATCTHVCYLVLHIACSNSIFSVCLLKCKNYSVHVQCEP